MQPLLIAPINHILRRNAWAQERLRAHAGKTVCIDCVPVTLHLELLADGTVAAAQPGARDVTIVVSPGVMLRMAARDDTAWRDVVVDGDPELASAIHHVWRNLRPEFEEDLSRVFGDVASHRIAEAAAALDRWCLQSFDNLARSLAEYWTEEQPLIARAHDIREFGREVDRLRDDVERLEKRAARLIAAENARSAS